MKLPPELIHQNVYQQVAWEKESPKQAFGKWPNKKVREMLVLYGLPADSSLSVLCVEVFGQITNISEQMDNFKRNKDEFVSKTSVVFNAELAHELNINLKKVQSPPAPSPIDPLNSQLGMYRILRTSPLTEVPFICSAD